MRIPLVFLIMLLIVITGCHRRIVPAGEAGLSKQLLKGQELFSENCNKCHPDGMAGRGPALFSKRLPGFVIRFQVRNGLGAMPSFKKQELPKSDLNNIVAYIKQQEAAFRTK